MNPPSWVEEIFSKTEKTHQKQTDLGLKFDTPNGGSRPREFEIFQLGHAETSASS